MIEMKEPVSKFNDMELIGAYARITVGRGITDGKVELKLPEAILRKTLKSAKSKLRLKKYFPKINRIIESLKL